MNRPARPAAAALALAAGALLAGCGSPAPAAPGPAAEAAPGGAPFLATSLVTAAGTWAVAVMGGPVAQEDNFWQLFARPAGSSRWTLVTPPGTADNGGLVLAGAGASLITGFRPSQYLTYTPLTVTRNAGRAWSSTGPLDGALADVPDALAAASATGHLLALTADGTAELAAPGYTSWATLATQRSLAATAPGRRCGLQDLTAAAFSPSGQPLLGGTCTRPGHRRHLRRHRRDLARSRARAARRPGRPARAGTQADQHGQQHGRAARRGHRASRQPGRRLVLRQRQPLGPVAPAPAERRDPELGLLRARRHSRDRAGRQPRRDRGGPRRPMAVTARTATGHRNAGPRSRGRIHRAGRRSHHDDRLAAPAGVSRVGQGTGHQRPRPVRLLKLKSLARVRLGQYGDRGKGAPRPGTRQADRAMPSGLQPDRPASQRVKIQRAGRDLAGRLSRYSLPTSTYARVVSTAQCTGLRTSVLRTSDIDRRRMAPMQVTVSGNNAGKTTSLLSRASSDGAGCTTLAAGYHNH